MAPPLHELALSWVPLREPVRLLFVSSPQLAPPASGRPCAPALIEGTIPLPGLTQLRSKSYLAHLYDGRHLSARQIAGRTGTSRSVALAALSRCGIPKNGRNRTHPGQLPQYLRLGRTILATSAVMIRTPRSFRLPLVLGLCLALQPGRLQPGR